MKNGLYELEFLRDYRRYSLPKAREDEPPFRRCLLGTWKEVETEFPVVLTAYLGPEERGFAFRIRAFLPSPVATTIPKWINWDSNNYFLETREGLSPKTSRTRILESMSFSDAIAYARDLTGRKLSPELVIMFLRKSYCRESGPERVVTDSDTTYIFLKNPDSGVPLGREKFLRVELKHPARKRLLLGGSAADYLRRFAHLVPSKKTQGYLRIRRYLDRIQL